MGCVGDKALHQRYAIGKPAHEVIKNANQFADFIGRRNLYGAQVVGFARCDFPFDARQRFQGDTDGNGAGDRSPGRFICKYAKDRRV